MIMPTLQHIVLLAPYKVTLYISTHFQPKLVSGVTIFGSHLPLFGYCDTSASTGKKWGIHGNELGGDEITPRQKWLL